MIFRDLRVPPRIWDKIAVSPIGCWLWRGAVAGVPQARRRVDYRVYKTVSVKRWLYEVEHGPQAAPAIGTTCECLCVNPDHAIAGTHLEIVAAWNAINRQPITHCPHGHDLELVGTYSYKRKGRTFTHCKACSSIRGAYKRRRRRGRRSRRSVTWARLWAEGKLRRRDGNLAYTVALPSAKIPST